MEKKISERRGRGDEEKQGRRKRTSRKRTTKENGEQK